MEELVRKLEERQRAEGLGDEAFAGTLGVSRIVWNGIKNGRRRLSLRLCLAAMRKYPSLTDDILRYMHSLADEHQKQEVA